MFGRGRGGEGRAQAKNHGILVIPYHSPNGTSEVTTPISFPGWGDGPSGRGDRPPGPGPGPRAVTGRINNYRNNFSGNVILNAARVEVEALMLVNHAH